MICTQRNYRAGQFLSPTERCPECPWEEADIFHGTGGKWFYGWYCAVEPMTLVAETRPSHDHSSDKNSSPRGCGDVLGGV